MQGRVQRVMWIAACLVLAGTMALAGRDMMVNGYTFSRLNVRQQSTTITVSGQIQGGQDKYPLRAHIFVQNNLGQTFDTVVLVESYTGGPEKFTESFSIYRQARKWRVVAVTTN